MIHTVQERTAEKVEERQDSSLPSLRVLFVIPGSSGSTSMIFANRQFEAVTQAGITGRKFFLASRTDPRILLQERQRLLAEISAFQPDVVHAHYGTMTGFFCACFS